MKIGSFVGDFGRYHACICFLISLGLFNMGLDHLTFIFIAPPTKYNCSMPNQTSCCDNPVYDKTIFHRTIITEWNLICNRSWLRECHEILFQFGALLGGLIFGKMSDSYGRKHSLLGALVVHTFTSLIEMFMPDFWSFTIWRMASGVSEGGSILVAFVLLMEYIDARHRVIASTLYHVPFLLGHIVLTVCAYYIRDFVTLLVILCVPNLTFVLYICFLSESPLWLLAKNLTFKAIPMLERMAIINNKPTDKIAHQIELYQYYVRTDRKTKGNISQIFRSAAIRNNLLLLGCLWFVGGFCYYGGTFCMTYMCGDFFMNQIAAGSLCLFGCFIALPLIIYLRRRTIIILFNLSAGLFFLTAPAFPCNTGKVAFLSIGIMFSYMNIIIVYLYCYETFPILVRNVAIGFSSIMLHVGAMLGQLVVMFYVYGFWSPLVFGTVSTVAAFLFLYFLPNIKDCVVEEIEVNVLKPTTKETIQEESQATIIID